MQAKAGVWVNTTTTSTITTTTTINISNYNNTAYVK